MAQKSGESSRTQQVKPLLEWGAAAIGLLLTLGIIGYIGWQAVTGPGDAPPTIVVGPGQVSAYESGYVVEVVARNLTPSTAAGVEIEGKLMDGSREVAASRTTFSYVPGHSERRGGLFFSEDPRRHRLEVRALGYSRP